ncbi:glycine cleavage system protein R [Pseudoteredinibacter isoporae]|uniref:glycine cleavage system protein R n=1 Tax=Pseudoteredinibacter isoporae TaxID=570281 RepID=UPI003108E9D4
MDTCLVLTIISDDRPGVVEQIAACVDQHKGSWQESRMAHLDGKFAGILRVSCATEDVTALSQALHALESSGIQVLLSEGQRDQNGSQQSLHISAIGPDRPGIVLELSRAFAQGGFNVAQLDTDCSSMPWSGDPQFEAKYQLQVQGACDTDELQERLDAIADELALDIKIEEAS